MPRARSSVLAAGAGPVTSAFDLIRDQPGVVQVRAMDVYPYRYCIYAHGRGLGLGLHEIVARCWSADHQKINLKIDVFNYYECNPWDVLELIPNERFEFMETRGALASVNRMDQEVFTDSIQNHKIKIEFSEEGEPVPVKKKAVAYQPSEALTDLMRRLREIREDEQPF